MKTSNRSRFIIFLIVILFLQPALRDEPHDPHPTEDIWNKEIPDSIVNVSGICG